MKEHANAHRTHLTAAAQPHTEPAHTGASTATQPVTAGTVAHRFNHVTPPATTTARGYGRAHQTERRRLTPHVNAGQAFCTQPICVMPTRWIQPGTAWALGHTDDRTSWLGPVHSLCNQRDGARRGGHAATAQRRTRHPDTPARRTRNW